MMASELRIKQIVHKDTKDKFQFGSLSMICVRVVRLGLESLGLKFIGKVWLKCRVSLHTCIGRIGLFVIS